MKKKNNKKYLIAALVLVTLLGGFYFIYPAVQRSIYCPDMWFINDTFSSGPNANKETFFKNDRKVNLTIKNTEWIRKNCNLKQILSS